MNAVDIVLQIKDTQGNKAKETILTQHKDNEELQTLLYYAFNPFLTFGIQRILISVFDILENDKHNDFISILQHLSEKSISNSEIMMVQVFLSTCSERTGSLYRDILTKSLSIGMAAKSINKVMPNLIPTFECMLAEPAETFEGTLLVQEKLDGVRCITIKKDGKITCFTRSGNEIPLKRLKETLRDLPNDNFVIDGELLMAGELRQKTSGKINSLMKTGYKKEIDDKMEYHVFDLMTLEEWVSKDSKLTAFERAGEAKGLVNLLGYPFVEVNSDLVDTEEGVKKFYNEVRKAGGEGVIVKTNTPYEWKRSKNWGKLKAICSTTLKITGFTEGEGKNAGKVGAVTCESADKQVIVNVNPRTDAMRDFFTENKSAVINLPVEIIFNELIKSEDGTFSLFLPRFATSWQRVDKFIPDSLEDILRETKSNL